MNKFEIYFSFKEKEDINKTIDKLFSDLGGFTLFSTYGGWIDTKNDNKKMLDRSMKVEVYTDKDDKYITKLCSDIKEICKQKEVIYYKSKATKLNKV